jgi:methionyl-tRNA formyltransferase
VTLHWMDAAVDTGAVAYSASFPVDEEETGLSLTAKSVRNGVPLISRLLADAVREPSSIPVLEQDLAKRRYFGREAPNDGDLAWDKPAADVVRFVRAADYSPFESPWGTPQSWLGGEAVGIAKATLTAEAANAPPGAVGRVLGGGAVTVAAADEWVAVRRVWRAGSYARPGEICFPGDRFTDKKT